MGMACDAEGRAVTGEHVMPLAKTGGACGVQADETKTDNAAATADAPGLNPEETAMILTSLCKGQFSGAAATAAPGTPDSDGDDTGDFSDEDEDASHRRAIGGVGKVHRVQQINFDGPKGSKLDFTDDAGFSHRFRNESNRVKSLVTKHISIEELREHFDRPIIDVAKDFGICITLMKKICRRNGIKRWPHRQIRSLSKSIASMEAAMLSAHGSEREKYRDQIVNLKMKRESVIADPNKDNSMRPKMSPPSSMHGDSTAHSVRASSHQVSSTPKLTSRPGSDAQAASQSFPVTPTVNMEGLAVGTPAPTSSTSTTGPSKGGRWTSEEHAAFLEGIRLYGKDWRRVAQVVMTRSAVQTRTHAQKYLLKFAGRFPFDADGVLKDHHPAPVQTQYASQDKPVASMLSPTTSVASSNAAMTPASDDCMSNGSWNSEEAQAPAKHGEAMAMILNGSPQVEPEAEPRSGSTALPPLPSRPTIKMEETAAPTFQQQHPFAQQGAVPASFQYFPQQGQTPQQLAP